MMLLLALLAQIDPALPDYRPEGELQGPFHAFYGDDMSDVVTLWCERLKRAHPGLDLSIEGKWCWPSPPLQALGTGWVPAAAMTRPFTERERERYRELHGRVPTEIQVGWGSLAIFVHKDNPIRYLTLEQVDAAFSKTRRRGHREVKTWGDLGLEGEWAARPVSPYGRSPVAAARGHFRQAVLLGGDYKDEIQEQPGSASVVLGCSTDPAGIGYAGPGYAVSAVRAVPIVPAAGGEPVAATSPEAYPLARALWVVVDPPPGPRAREFVRLALSKQGQEVVAMDGHHPLTAARAAERKKLD
jgi:phosphate transport system substrate-binding protein